MRCRSWLVLWVPVLLLTLCGCRGTASPAVTGGKADVVVALSASSTAVGPATLTITVNAANGAPVENAKIDVLGDMTHAGMSPVTASVEGGQGTSPQGAGGKYTVPFQWSMGGDWVLTVTVTLPDGARAVQTFNFKGITS